MPELRRRLSRLVSPIGPADTRLASACRRLVRRTPGGDALAVNTTDLGSLYMVAGAGTVLAASGRRRDAAVLAVTGLLGWLVGQESKRLFNRRRPYEVDPALERLIRPPTGSSFPSGHATVAVAVASVMADRARPGRRWPWRVLALWVPITRIHVGVHYPGDVAGGAVLGWAIGRIVRALAPAPRR